VPEYLEESVSQATAAAEATPEDVAEDAPVEAPVQDTEVAIVEEESPPVTAASETSDDATPETDEPPAPETEAPRTLESLSDDEFRDSERFKSLSEAEIAGRVASTVESERQRFAQQQLARAAEARQADADEFLREGLTRDMAAFAKAVADSDTGQLTADHMPALNQLVARTTNVAQESAVQAARNAFQGAVEAQFTELASIGLPEGWATPDDIAADYNTASGAGDVVGQSKALLRSAFSAGRFQGDLDGRKAVAAEAQKDVKAAEAVVAEERAKNGRQQEPSPTAGSGEPASSVPDADVIGNSDYSAEAQDAAYLRLKGVPYEHR